MTSERATRSAKRSRKRKIQDMLSVAVTEESCVDIGATDGYEVLPNNTGSGLECVNNENEEGSGTGEGNETRMRNELEQKIKKLEEEKRLLQVENDALKTKVNILESESNNRNIHAIVEDILKPMFTSTQIDALINKRVVRKWSDEDITSALTLRSMSSKCYEYLRKKKGMPLPCKSTLNERAKNFACEPGVLHSVLSLMKSKSETFDKLERCATPNEVNKK
ncbi:hypothetical protein Pmani_019481 [Petrolisthes manimaculis]|uniref:THAP9-like helix-turn-helix domain-containing protein n=1 Tax=Petrolisthes manimaculis TaxID=1843537 RepID=A0AAE1PKL9_9EUCA|nr:hypothetical protein Pmani_019481 [Petrolisthes manimaculis]